MAARTTALQRRADRALERQLAYQEAKAVKLRGSEPQVLAAGRSRAQSIRARLEAVRPISDDARVLEVGCGAHGLIFFFGARRAVGVDPLADHYRQLFPAWQGDVQTIAAPGENLPFDNASFDVVLCDNVVDHAESPRRIVEEIARVLAPGGLLFFEVNVHHRFYSAMASLHAAWRAIGIPVEITPFADHTVHLTRKAAVALFADLPFEIVEAHDDIAKVKQRAVKVRHAGDWLKRLFFKNASFELIAIRAADTP